MLPEPFFDSWPRRLNGVTIEPGSGQVRLKPIVGAAFWLPVADIRELAVCADPVKRAVLQAAAMEATRQEACRAEDMEGRAV